MKQQRDTQIIRSLEKGLILLETIEQETYPVTLHTLWKKLGWDKASILRMCNTLERRGYIQKDPATRQYSLGRKIFGLYDSIIKHIDIQQLAGRFLQQISTETGESAHLAFFIEKSAVFVDKVLGSIDPPINVQIGGREPLHCTAMGKSFLAYNDKETIRQLLDEPLKKFTSCTIDSLERLERELSEVRARSYAIDNEEYIDGVRCIAAPILNHTGHPAAAIGISAPIERLPVEKIGPLGEYIKGRAMELSAQLGYTTPKE